MAKTSNKKEYWRMLLIAGAIALAGAAGWWFLTRTGPAIGGNDRAVLMVLPVGNFTEDEGNDFLVDALTRDLMEALARQAPEQLQLIGMESVYAFKRQPEDQRSTAHRYGADFLLESSLRIDSGEVQLASQLVRTRGRKVVWTDTSNFERLDFIDQQDELREKLVAGISHALLGPVEVVAPMPLPENTRTRLDYLRARYLAVVGDLRQRSAAAQAMQRLVDREPDYYPVKLELADLLLAANSPQAVTDAMTLLQDVAAIRPQDSRALARLAEIQGLRLWQFVSALQVFDELISSAQLSSRSQRVYANLLMINGQGAKAVNRLQEALRVDPEAASLYQELGWFFYLNGQHEAAVTACEQAAARQPESLAASRCAQAPLVALGRQEEAAVNALKIVRQSGGNAGSAPKHPPQATLDWFNDWQLRQLAGRDGPGLAMARALLHAQMGDSERALESLENAWDARDSLFPFLEQIPEFTPLRGTDRFQALVQELASSQD